MKRRIAPKQITVGEEKSPSRHNEMEDEAVDARGELVDKVAMGRPYKITENKKLSIGDRWIGKRNVRRQLLRWTYDLVKVVCSRSMQDAPNRSNWRCIGEL